MKSINFMCDCCGKYISKEWSNRLKDKHMTFDHYHEEYTYFTIQRETVTKKGIIKSGYVDLCVDCHNKYMDLVKEQTEVKRITPSEIVEVYKNMMERQEYESRWISPDGLKHITDTGYAAEGAFFFLQELLTELNAVDLLKTVEEE